MFKDYHGARPREAGGVTLGRAFIWTSLCLSLWGQATVLNSSAQTPAPYATQQSSGYNSPGTASLHCQFYYQADKWLFSLLWEPFLPDGWRLETVSGDGIPEIKSNSPAVVFTGDLTNNPVSFTLSVAVPPGESGPRQFSGHVEYQFENMTNPASVRASPDPAMLDSHHIIETWADENSLISPSGAVSIVHGGTTNFTISSSRYYNVADVVVDGLSEGATGSYVFTNVTEDHTIDVFATEALACLGTPEWWIAMHGLTNAATDFCSAETNDTDGDAMPTWQEWLADTIPTNSDSSLRLTQVDHASGSVTIEWKGGTSAWQCLQASLDLADTNRAWISLLTNRPPTPEAGNYTHDGVTHGALFYRIKAWRSE